MKGETPELYKVTAHKNPALRETNPHNKLFQPATANKPKAAKEAWHRNRSGRSLHRMPTDQPDVNNDLPHLYGGINGYFSCEADHIKSILQTLRLVILKYSFD